MRTRSRSAVFLASAAALGVGLIALPASAAAAPPVVPDCTPKPSTGSDSCVRLQVNPLAPPIGPGFENVRLGFRARSAFDPANDEISTLTWRFDDDIALNLAGIPTCPARELFGKNIAQAYEQCGPGADGNPSTEGNAFLSPPGNVSGIGSTAPPSNLIACLMLFKGSTNNLVTIYARVPVASATTGCDNPATNTAGSATVIFTGQLSHQPPASGYDWTLRVPDVDFVNPAVDDLYATLSRGGAFRARCPAGTSPHKLQGVFDYTTTPIDIISPPYAGTTDPCP
jgi:hypothetical protein